MTKNLRTQPPRRAVWLALFACAALLLNNANFVRAQDPGFEFGLDQGDTQKGKAVASSYIEAMALVEDKYSGEVDPERLCEGAATGMLRTLDPHSSFFTREEFLDFRGQQQAQYSGVGALIVQYGEKVYVWSPFEDTPAYRAGLRYGDEITAIDGESTAGWDSAKVRGHLRGLRGTPVMVTVQRPGEAQPMTVRIVRDSVGQPTVSNIFMVKPGVGYLAFRRGFGQASGEEVAAAVRRLKSLGATSVIIDIRDNPGGLVDAARQIADQFLARGQKIVTIKGRSKSGNVFENPLTSNNSAPEDLALVMLINGGSASASEILAGSIQDHDRGILVGETSFGKGLVQSVYPLPEGYGLTLTSAKYYTPSGRLIQRQYDHASLYEYQRRKSVTEVASGNGENRFLTDGKRPVLGGVGIEPDVKVKPDPVTLAQFRLQAATFAFGRMLVNGQISGFPEYRVSSVDFQHTLADADFSISDKLFENFKKFVAEKGKEYGVTAAMLPGNETFIRQQLRREIVTAAYGYDTSVEITIANDSQVLKGIGEVENARRLAQGVRKTNNGNPNRPAAGAESIIKN